MILAWIEKDRPGVAGLECAHQGHVEAFEDTLKN